MNPFPRPRRSCKPRPNQCASEWSERCEIESKGTEPVASLRALPHLGMAQSHARLRSDG